VKKKLILHIGCEKTGSTSIQNTLALNRDHLFNTYGIYYPKSLGEKNHTKLAIYCCNSDKNLSRFLKSGQSIEEFRAELLDAFNVEIEAIPAQTVIISCEWLHPRMREVDEFERLKSLFSDLFDEVTILVYLRRQDKLVTSLYSTSLRAGNHHRFSFKKYLKDNKLPYALNFLAIYQNWQRNLSPSVIELRVFDKRYLYQQDVVKDFLKYLDLSLDDIQYLNNENQSINAVGIGILRRINKLLHRFNKWVMPHTAKRIRHAIANFFIGKAMLATEQECREFAARFDEVNARLERQYFDDTGKEIRLF
jgi:hypothetical protein